MNRKDPAKELRCSIRRIACAALRRIKRERERPI
jgi:hypothetical protein